jgi:hypothetical protein
MLTGAFRSVWNVSPTMSTFAVQFIISAIVFSRYKLISSTGKLETREKKLVEWAPRAP